MRLPDLLVVEFAVGPPEIGDSRAVAQSQEEALPLKETKFGTVRDLRHVMGIYTQLTGRAADQERAYVVGIGHLDQMGHLVGRAEDQPRLDELVGGMPLIGSLETCEPAGQALDEPHAREELLVAVVFVSGHGL